MSELRDELEAQFASAETQSDNVQKVDETEEQTQTTPAEVDEWLNAPAAYTQDRKDNFKNLPQDWRKYLIEREKQTEKGFSEFGNKINSYKYIDDLYNGRQDRLKQFGINSPRQWAEFWSLISDGLAVNPQATVDEIKNIYGLNGNATPNSNDNELLMRLNAQERQLQQLQSFLQGDKIKRDIDAFVNSKDDAGNPKYPYFNDVKQNIGILMDRGVCKTLEEAYNQSVWANEEVRKKLMDAQQKAELNAKTEAAEKAKQAGFSPTSKATAPERELTLREELEKQFDELG